MEIGKVAQRKDLRRKTLNRSVPASESIDSSPVVNEDEVAETQNQQEAFKEDVAEISLDDETKQSCLLHHSRHDNESTAATSSVDAKCSIAVRLLKNGTGTQTPEEQLVNFGAFINITRFGEEPSSEVLIPRLMPSSDEQKELQSVTSEAVTNSTPELRPSASSSLLTIHTAWSTEQFSKVSFEGERHKLSGVSSQQQEVLIPEETKVTTAVPAPDNYVLKDALKTLDTVLSRGRLNVVDQQSELLGEARAVIGYFKESSQPNAEPLSSSGLIDVSTENRSPGRGEDLNPIALQSMPQEPTNPIMKVHILEELGIAESISPDLPTSLPMRKTRSGARFSDDTNMLKDFLIRAHAKKAAKSKEVATISNGGQSPRRSPRKVLRQPDRNSPSHTKSQDPTCSLNTPPGNNSLDRMNVIDDNDELCGETNLRRRSARTCTIVLEKTTMAPLCFIPVRRPDGSEPVVLQKSAAQELAITTRANTRRNKGLSKLPKFMLETLTTAIVEDAPVKSHEIRAAKSVDWDKNLVYFQQSSDGKAGKEKKEGKEEVRSGAKSLKGLGNVSGIPAPKSVVVKAYPSNGTPAPKRRGKRKSR